MKICYLFLICILCSCSSLKWSSFFDDEDESLKRNDKLMKSFEVDDEVLQKFETKKEDEIEDTSEVDNKISNTNNTDKKSTPVETIEKSSNITKVVAPKKTISKKEVKEKKPKSEKSKFPKDYPGKYKTLSKDSQKFWKQYTPKIFEGERFYLDINYMGVSTGKIVLSTMEPIIVGGTKSYHFNAKVKTSSYYSYLYELDDTVDSYVNIEKFLPVKFSLIQRETDKDIDDLQLFDFDKLKTYTFYKKVTPDKTKKKKKEEFIPGYYVDPLSIIFFLRGLPMKKGNEYVIPIMNKGKIIMFNARVVGTSKIDTKIGEKEAYVMKAHTKYSGDTLKSGDMTFWFSADEKRIFLKFEAEISIGSITGDIEKYEQ